MTDRTCRGKQGVKTVPFLPTITKLTSETALREILHQYMKPSMSVMIMLMVARIMSEEARSNVKKRVTMKTEAREMPKLIPVSSHMVRYCS